MAQAKNKQKKWKRPIHSVVTAVLRFVLRPYFKLRYNYTAKRCGLPKDYPCVILSNHQTFFDQFLVGMSFPYPVYMMATERIFNMGLISKLLSAIVAPIPKKKSRVDINAVRISTKVLREGGKVLIFPEGNCSYTGKLGYVSPAIAKMIKMLKAPLVLYNLHGGFGLKPRWALSARRGKATGQIVKILKPEEYESLSNEELMDVIITTLTTDEFNLGVDFKSSKRAEGLEKFLYYCPDCKSFNTLTSRGAHLTCTKCGARAEYGVNLTLNAVSAKNMPVRLYDYDALQATALRELILSGGVNFEDEGVKLCHFENGKTKLIKKGSIRMDGEELTVAGKSFPLSQIESVTIQQKSAIIFYVGDTTYFVKGGKRFNPVKYTHAYYIIKDLSEGGDNDKPISDVYLGL